MGATSIPGYRFGGLVLPPSPLTATMKPFLSGKGGSAQEIEAMHAAWSKAVLLQVILWCQPCAREGDF
jgi:hypothetical protein